MSRRSSARTEVHTEKLALSAESKAPTGERGGRANAGVAGVAPVRDPTVQAADASTALVRHPSSVAISTQTLQKVDDILRQVLMTLVKTNIVCTARLRQPVPINVAAYLLRGHYTKTKFPSVIGDSVHGSWTLFEGGYIRSAGADTQERALYVLYRMMNRLHLDIGLRFGISNFQVHNNVLTARLPYRINLARLHLCDQTKYTYQPASFPGVIVHLDKPDVRLAMSIFGSGNVIMAGASHTDHGIRCLEQEEGTLRSCRLFFFRLDNSTVSMVQSYVAQLATAVDVSKDGKQPLIMASTDGKDEKRAPTKRSAAYSAKSRRAHPISPEQMSLALAPALRAASQIVHYESIERKNKKQERARKESKKRRRDPAPPSHVPWAAPPVEGPPGIVPPLPDFAALAADASAKTPPARPLSDLLRPWTIAFQRDELVEVEGVIHMITLLRPDGQRTYEYEWWRHHYVVILNADDDHDAGQAMQLFRNFLTQLCGRGNK